MEVQNQGDAEETDVGVSFELTGGTQTISGDTTIPRIAAGGIQTATRSRSTRLPTPASS